MKNNKMRFGAVLTLAGLASLAGWQIHQGRTLADGDVAADSGRTSWLSGSAEESKTALTVPQPRLLSPSDGLAAISDTVKGAIENANPFTAQADRYGPPLEAAAATVVDVANNIEKQVAQVPDAIADTAKGYVTAAAYEVQNAVADAGQQLLARGQNAADPRYLAGNEPNPLRAAPTSNIAPPPAQASPRRLSDRVPDVLPPTENAKPLAPVNNSPRSLEPVTPAGHNGRYGGAQASGGSRGFDQPRNTATPYTAEPPAARNDIAPLQPRTANNAYTTPPPTRVNALDVPPPTALQPMSRPISQPALQPRGYGQPTVQPMQPAQQTAGADGTGRPGEQALEGPQAPSVVIEKLAPEEIQVGKQCTFEIIVRNVGKATAHQVQVFDEVPQGTRLIGTSPQANNDGRGRVVWEFDSLAPGEEKTLEIQLMPHNEGDLGSVATVSFAAEASVRVRCTRPLLEVRSTTGRQVMLGDEHIVTVEVHNPGSGDATGVMLLENIPTKVSHPSGASLEFEIGTLRAGETRKLDLVLTAEEAGIVQNHITARGDANLQAEHTVEFEVIAPGLQVSIKGPRKRYLERQATYTVEVDNPGTATTKDIDLVTKLPRGMKFVKANNLGEYNANTHSVRWSLAELPANERGAVQFTMLPIEAGEQRMEVQTQARQGLTAEAEYPVLVEGLAAIMFEVVDVADPIEIGGETTYEIRVVNQGSKTATNVSIVATLPPGLKATGASGPTQHQLRQGQVVFAPLGRLAPKADTTYRINVQGVQAGDQRFQVQVITDELDRPVTKEESTRVYADE